MQLNNTNQDLYNFYEKYFIQILFAISIVITAFLMFDIYPKIKINSEKQEIKKILNDNHLFLDSKQNKQKLAIEHIKSFPLYIKLLESYKKDLNKTIQKIQNNIKELEMVKNINNNTNIVINNYKKKINKLETTINSIEKQINILKTKYKVYSILLKNNVDLTKSNVNEINNLYFNINKFIYNNLIKPSKNLTKEKILKNKFLEIIWKENNKNTYNSDELLQYPVKFKNNGTLIIGFVILVFSNVFLIGLVLFMVEEIFKIFKKITNNIGILKNFKLKFQKKVKIKIT